MRRVEVVQGLRRMKWRGGGSSQRVPVDELTRMLALCRSRPSGLRAKPCHQKLRQHHDVELGGTWTKLRRQDAGLVAKVPRRSAHRRQRPGRPLCGTLLRQDGATHRWRKPLTVYETGSTPNRPYADGLPGLILRGW